MLLHDRERRHLLQFHLATTGETVADGKQILLIAVSNNGASGRCHITDHHAEQKQIQPRILGLDNDHGRLGKHTVGICGRTE